MFLATYRHSSRTFIDGNFLLPALQFVSPNMTTARRDLVRCLEDLYEIGEDRLQGVTRNRAEL